MRSIYFQWERRAKMLGDSFESVMEQSFPLAINQYIHEIHLREILKNMPKGVKKVLDVGCGWGRIASEIVKKRRCYISGVDASKHFVRLFNLRVGKNGKAITGDMRKLPYKNNTFDTVYCVVTLMYLSSFPDQEKAISEMFRVLKTGGTLILIEPNRLGIDLVRVGGIVPYLYRKVLKKSKIETYGISFLPWHITRMLRNIGFEICGVRGYPMFTMFLLFLVAFEKFFPGVTRSALRICKALDGIIPSGELSYFTTWVAKK